MTSDQDFRRALGRREPPEGFAERTLARIAREGATPAAEPPAREPRTSRSAVWISAALAASLLVGVGGFEFEARQREANGRRAAEDLVVALSITNNTLHDVQDRVSNVAAQLGEDHHDEHRPSR